MKKQAWCKSHGWGGEERMDHVEKWAWSKSHGWGDEERMDCVKKWALSRSKESWLGR